MEVIRYLDDNDWEIEVEKFREAGLVDEDGQILDCSIVSDIYEDFMPEIEEAYGRENVKYMKSLNEAFNAILRENNGGKFPSIEEALTSKESALRHFENHCIGNKVDENGKPLKSLCQTNNGVYELKYNFTSVEDYIAHANEIAAKMNSINKKHCTSSLWSNGEKVKLLVDNLIKGSNDAGEIYILPDGGLHCPLNYYAYGIYVCKGTTNEIFNGYTGKYWEILYTTEGNETSTCFAITDQSLRGKNK